MGTNSHAQAPAEKTRYSIPFFLGVNLNLTLDELKSSAADIASRIPYSDDSQKRAVDVPSEFMSPEYTRVRILERMTHTFRVANN